MKKWEKIAFVTLCVVLLLIPVYTMPFMGQTSPANNAEKRELAAKPALFADGKFNRDFFEQMGDYLADHFTLRTQRLRHHRG